MTTLIPYGRQDISDADIQAVVDVLRSDYLTQGPAVPAFEKSIADYCGAEVDFVDIDPNTYNLSVQCLSEKLDQTEQYYAENCMQSGK